MVPVAALKTDEHRVEWLTVAIMSTRPLLSKPALRRAAWRAGLWAVWNHIVWTGVDAQRNSALRLDRLNVQHTPLEDWAMNAHALTVLVHCCRWLDRPSVATW